MCILFNPSSKCADFRRGIEQHPHHRRPGEREDFCGAVRGAATRSVRSGPEESQGVRSLLRLLTVRRVPNQLRLLQVRRLLGATGGAPFQLGVQVRGESFPGIHWDLQKRL